MVSPISASARHTHPNSSVLATRDFRPQSFEVPSYKSQSAHQKIPAVGPQSWMHLSLALLKVLWTKVSVFLSKSLFCSPRWAPTLPLQNINHLSCAITILSSGLQLLLDTQIRWNPQQPKSQLYSNILCNVIVQKQWLKLLLFWVGQRETISEGERAFSYDPPYLLLCPLFFFRHSPYDCPCRLTRFPSMQHGMLLLKNSAVTSSKQQDY